MANCFNLNLQQLNTIIKYCNIDILASIEEPIS